MTDREYLHQINTLPCPDPVAGYFGPDSMTWRLYREPLIALGGPRALLLQVAHPAVAEGVARFSNFKADALGRGFRTFAAMATIYFGSAEQARQMAQRLRRVHHGIRGEYQAANGQLTGAKDEAQKTSSVVNFSANDDYLLRWVLATLVETTLIVFENIPVGHLPYGWQEQFFGESKAAAQLMGIPPAEWPADLPAFRQYCSDMLHSDLLGSSPTSHELTQALVHHRYSPPRLVQLLAAGWMPTPLAVRLGLEAGTDPARRLARWLKKVRIFYRLLPPGLRYSPAYHQALRRIAKRKGESGPLLGKWYDWLTQKMRLPLGLPAG